MASVLTRTDPAPSSRSLQGLDSRWCFQQSRPGPLKMHAGIIKNKAWDIIQHHSPPINQERSKAENPLMGTALFSALRGTSKFIPKFKILNHVFLHLPKGKSVTLRRIYFVSVFLIKRKTSSIYILRTSKRKRTPQRQSWPPPQKGGALGRMTAYQEHVVGWCTLKPP